MDEQAHVRTGLACGAYLLRNDDITEQLGILGFTSVRHCGNFAIVCYSTLSLIVERKTSALRQLISISIRSS
jgi:hypothetical protein